MNDYTRKDINSYDTFTKYGDTFTKIYADDENHIYVFKCGFGYEVVKGIKSVNPDNTIIYHYPSTEQFGTYGYYIFGSDDKYCKERIEYRIKCLKEKK